MVQNLPDKTNYYVQICYCHIDYMAVALLFNFFAADKQGTEILILLSSYFFYRLKRNKTDNYNEFCIMPRFDVLKNELPPVRFFHSIKKNLYSYVTHFKPPYHVILAGDSMSRSDNAFISIVAHERCHAIRHDPLITTMYDLQSFFVVSFFVYFLFVGVYLSIFPPTTFNDFSIYQMVPILVYYAPSLGLFLSRNSYYQRREFAADAMAGRYLGGKYLKFIEIAKNRSIKFSKPSSPKHPSFSDRFDFLYGKRKTVLSLFWVGIISHSIILYSILALNINLIYDPDNLKTNQFDFFKNILSITIFSVCLYNYIRVFQNFAEYLKNEKISQYFIIIFSIILNATITSLLFNLYLWFIDDSAPLPIFFIFYISFIHMIFILILCYLSNFLPKKNMLKAFILIIVLISLAKHYQNLKAGIDVGVVFSNLNTTLAIIRYFLVAFIFEVFFSGVGAILAALRQILAGRL